MWFVLSLISVKAFRIDFSKKQTHKHTPAVFCHAQAALEVGLVITLAGWWLLVTCSFPSILSSQFHCKFYIFYTLGLLWNKRKSLPMKQAVEVWWAHNYHRSQNKDGPSPLAASAASPHITTCLVSSFPLKQKFSLPRNQAGIMYEINVPYSLWCLGLFFIFQSMSAQIYQMPKRMILQGAEENAGKAHTK